METPTTTTEGTAPVIQTPAVTPQEKPTAREIVASLTPEQRRLVAGGRFEQLKSAAPAPEATPAQPTVTETPAVAAPAVETPAPVAATPAIETPTAPAADSAGIDGESPDSPDAANSKSKRFRFTDEKDQAVAMFAKANGLTLIEAAQRLAPQQPTSAPATPPTQAQQPAPTPAVDSDLTAYDARIAEAQTRAKALVEQRKKANEDLDQDKVLELTDAIAEAKYEARLLDNEKQGLIKNREQQSRQGYEQQVTAARDRVFAEFDVFAKEDSMERMALDSYARNAINDPARANLAANPNWPEIVAREFAQKHGIKPKGQAAGQPPAVAAPVVAPKPTTLPRTQPTQVASTQPKGAKLLTGAGGQQSPAPSAMTRDDVMHVIRTNPEARRAIVRNLSTLSTSGRR